MKFDYMLMMLTESVVSSIQDVLRVASSVDDPYKRVKTRPLKNRQDDVAADLQPHGPP
jgi:hypothetical protein